MKVLKTFFKDNKYLKVEIVFFTVILFLVPLLSDLEYAFYEHRVEFTDECLIPIVS